MTAAGCSKSNNSCPEGEPTLFIAKDVTGMQDGIMQLNIALNNYVNICNVSMDLDTVMALNILCREYKGHF